LFAAEIDLSALQAMLDPGGDGTMSDFPKTVAFREAGPREGFQIEKRIYPIEQRVEFIDLLSEASLKRIQVGSFFSPKDVPQMADAGELYMLIKRKPGVHYTSLPLNEA
jgi:hydroxymethylglutaryl-CoA lyase